MLFVVVPERATTRRVELLVVLFLVAITVFVATRALVLVFAVVGVLAIRTDVPVVALLAVVCVVEVLGTTFLVVVFVACFVPPAGYIEGKINGLRLQFCPTLAPIEIASKEIPDITWSIGDSSFGSAVHMSDVVIVDNSFLRNNIVAIRSIICGFVWFLFVINKLFALLRYLNVVQVPEGLKGGSDK